jgi:hypothetical protein
MPRAGRLFLALTSDSSLGLTGRQTTRLIISMKTRLKAMLAASRGGTHEEWLAETLAQVARYL